MAGLVNVDLGAVKDVVMGVINRVWPDKSAEEKAALDRQLQIDLGQIETNKAEAASVNWWVAGWRPFIGWVCGAGLFYQFFLMPIMGSFGVKAVAIDMGSLITLLFAILGVGSMRTAEKMTGSEGNRS